MKTRLEEKFKNEVVAGLTKELGLKNPHQVPSIAKVVINIGTGRNAQDKHYNETVLNTVRKITAQKPIETKAKSSVAGFKLRKGQSVGLKVTLRGQRMWEFLDRMLSLVLPRMRDFHGLPRQSFDKNGNYSIGIRDQSVFPELNYEDTATVHGLQINITTTTNDVAASTRLLEMLGFPLEKTRDSQSAAANAKAMATAGAANKSQEG